jgi:hypothetical protein
MKTLAELSAKIKEYCNQYPIMDDRIKALSDAGYKDIRYVHVKHNGGLCAITHLPTKHIYRFKSAIPNCRKDTLLHGV